MVPLLQVLHHAVALQIDREGTSAFKALPPGMSLPQNADLVLYESANLVLKNVLADRSQPPTLNAKLRPPELRFFIILHVPQEDIFIILSP